MKKLLTCILALTISTVFVLNSLASVKKRDLDKREVESVLRKIGGEHIKEEMKITEVGMIKTKIPEEEDEGGIKAYYWIYCGILDDDAGYRTIVFNNEPRYLGYYELAMEPVECGEGTIVFDTADFDLDRDPVTDMAGRWSIKIPASGPPKRIIVGNTTVEFVAAPTLEEVEKKKKEERAAAAEQAQADNRSGRVAATPEYRSWQVKHDNRMITVESAIFVEYKGGMVTIKDAKTGRTVSKPLRSFSAADQAYLKTVIR